MAAGLLLLGLGAGGCVEVIVEHVPGPDAGRDGAVEGDAADTEDDADVAPGDDAGLPSEGDASADAASADDAAVSGKPSGTWKNVTGSLASLASECGNVTAITASPKDGRVIVGVARHGLYVSANGGSSWEQLGKGAGSAGLNFRTTQIVFDPAKMNDFYVAGIYGQPGVARTTDNGATFRTLGDVWHNDGLSVDFADPERKTLLAGTHEKSKVVWLSKDAGQTWVNIGDTLPDDSGWSTSVHIVDRTTFLVGCVGSGIYRTTDSGAHWAQVSKIGGGAAPLLASDGSLYWASSNGDALARSTDQGATWVQVAEGGTVYPIRPIELPDGRIATRGPKGVLVSSDRGAHWVAVAPPEPFADPFRAFSLAYSTDQKAFFVSQWTCSDKVASDAIVRFDWDYQQ